MKSEERIVKSDRGSGGKMKNRYRIIVCDLEEKEVKIDKEIDTLIGSYAVNTEEKGCANIYSIGFGQATMMRIENMNKAAEKVVKEFKKSVIKNKIKEMFGVRK